MTSSDGPGDGSTPSPALSDRPSGVRATATATIKTRDTMPTIPDSASKLPIARALDTIPAPPMCDTSVDDLLALSSTTD